MKDIFCTLFFFILAFCQGFSQNAFTEQYNCSVLNMSGGLPNNFVDDIYTDSNGFVWISTHGGGLVRYDGYTYQYFGVGNQGINLSSNSCKNVYEDNFHRLWIAFEEGVEVIDLETLYPVNLKCTTHALSKELKVLMGENCIRVYKDSKGLMWFLTRKHFCRVYFDRNGDVCDIKAFRYSAIAPDVAIKDLYSDGNVLIGYDGKVGRMIVRKGKLIMAHFWNMPTDLPGSFVTDLIRYQNHIWVATNAGLYCLGEKVICYSLHNRKITRLSHDFVSSLAISSNGRLLIGTLCGVDILDGKNGKMEYWNALSKINPLSSNFVNCIYTYHKQIWVGTETGGIVKLVPQYLELINYVHSKEESSLSPNAVNAMYVEPGGTLWVGTVEGGLNRRIAGTKSFIHYTTANSGLTHNSVSTLTVDHQNRLWIGTWGAGVCIMDLSKPESIISLSVPRKYASLLMFVGAMAYDRINNGMWIGTNAGLYFYSFTRHQVEDPFPKCRNIKGCIGSLVTRNGFLLMGCGNGLVVVDLKSRPVGKGFFKMRQFKYKLDAPESGIIDEITSFYQTSDGTIWMGSNGYGLYRLTFRNKIPVVHSFTMKQGLVNNAVKGIVEDRKGLLWLTTDHGLSLFNPRTGVFTNYMEGDGLLSSQFYYNSAIRSSNGHLFFGTEKGLIELVGEHTPYIYSGKLHFTRLLVGSQEVRAHTRYLDKDISIAKQINLHESDRSFTIEFSSLSYGSETQGIYSYRMKGFEDKWMFLPPGQHSVRYSTLPSGHYDFEVKYISSMNMDDHNSIISIDVHVIPYFWKSWWFITLMLVSLAVFVFYLYKSRLEKVRKLEAEQLYRPIEVVLKKSKDPGILQQRIQNILNNQKLYDSSSHKSVMADKAETVKTKKSFMERIMEILELNYDDSSFGVVELCEQMHTNKSTLSVRLKLEAGVSTIQFIRDYRLDIAKKLLEENKANRNVAEIAYRVGFNDPKYFTRCFTKKYGISPSFYYKG
jgi:ligand-binding sensor domain-containing protein/AraC-like DNA-binding protein